MRELLLLALALAIIFAVPVYVVFCDMHDVHARILACVEAGGDPAECKSP